MHNVLKKSPEPLSIEAIELPLTEIDHLTPLGPTFLYNLVSKILGFNLKSFSLPDRLTGKENLPEYLLQEFHNIPNGYYSVFFSRGYSSGFNFFMLGEMHRIRKSIARELSNCTAILDIGCGDGSSTKTLIDEGIKEIWGLDPCPYLLAQAIQRNESAKFIQGIAEATDFHDQSFDGISACWVFHEIPTDICDVILKECFRLLKPGGKLVFMEPSKLQFNYTYGQIFKKFGVRGVYYKFLAKVAHEPYVNEWHQKNIKNWMENHGFKLVSNEISLPEEKIVAVKVCD